MNEKIHFSWDIHYSCNYRCPYCWFDGRWDELSKQNKYFALDDILKAWKRIYDKYGSVQIEILGGEPFTYPNFKEIIKNLSKMHRVGVTTNLSVAVDDIVEAADTSHLNIQPTFHPQFANFESFIEKAKVLKEKNMCSSVFYLAYPPQIQAMEDYKDKFGKYGISLHVMTFWGKYNGKEYPEGYTKEEKEFLKDYLGSRDGEKYQLKPKEVKGKLCRAGQVSAGIKADGNVYRCGGNTPMYIGSFFSEDFKLLEHPAPCESDYCPCNEWVSLLVENNNKKEEVKENGL